MTADVRLEAEQPLEQLLHVSVVSMHFVDDQHLARQAEQS
jgi:hypothetical protein